MSVLDEAPVLLERRGRVAIITLNRPAKLNAMTTRMMNDLCDTLEELGADDGVGVIVLTGAGERAFSAGRDLGEEMEERSEQAPARPARSAGAYATLSASPKPTIAAIRGYAYGGGAILALGCDIRIAAEDARFKFPGATYGLPAAGTQLPAVVGQAKAKELLFTGDVVDAPEALRIGLVNQVVPIAQLLDYSVAMAERIAANSAATLHALKEIANLIPPLDQANARQKRADLELRQSDETGVRLRQAADRVVRH